jgi:hypothetical protein
VKQILFPGSFGSALKKLFFFSTRCSMNFLMLAVDCQLVNDKTICTAWLLPTTNVTTDPCHNALNIKVREVYIFVSVLGHTSDR